MIHNTIAIDISTYLGISQLRLHLSNMHKTISIYLSTYLSIYLEKTRPKGLRLRLNAKDLLEL